MFFLPIDIESWYILNKDDGFPLFLTDLEGSRRCCITCPLKPYICIHVHIFTYIPIQLKNQRN